MLRKFHGTQLTEMNDQCVADVRERMFRSLEKDQSSQAVMWWRGYLAALDEWGLLKNASEAFACLPEVVVEPSIDQFDFDFEIDVFDADIQLPKSKAAEVEGQPETLPGDNEINEDVWISGIDWDLGKGKHIVTHGELRKLLLIRWLSLETAFAKTTMPWWLPVWWKGYVYSLKEWNVLTLKDAESFNEYLSGWSTALG